MHKFKKRSDGSLIGFGDDGIPIAILVEDKDYKKYEKQSSQEAAILTDRDKLEILVAAHPELFASKK